MEKIWKIRAVPNETGTRTFRRPKPLDVAHPSRRLLWFLGVYPGKVIKHHPLSKIARQSVFFLLTLLPLLMLIKIVVDGRSNLLEGWSIMSVHVFLLLKLVVYARSKKIPLVEKSLESEIFNCRTVPQDRFVSRAVRNLKIYGRVIRFSCWICIVAFVLFVPSDVESLLLPIWIPADLGRIFWHSYEVVSFVLSTGVFSAIDNCVLGLIANTCAQFQTLRDNLENSCERNPEECYGEQESKIQRRLGNCVRHHNAVLQYFYKMEESLSALFFSQIFFSTLGICLSGFQFLLVPIRSFRFFLCSAYLIGYLMQILSCCAFAQDMINQSSGIAKSCFVSDWYTCCASTKKMFLIIMERAKEPTTLRAGPFFTLSLRTFVMILRSAYSYYAVLRSVYKN